MSASLHLGIRDAVAALYAAPAALSARILENRELAMPAGADSQIHVFRVLSVPTPWTLQGGPIDWATQIRTVIKARKTDAETAEALADAIAVECYARVMAFQSLGGLAMQLDVGAFSWEQEEADSAVVQVTWDVTYQHRTTQQSISS
jgi:hypothetical protein